MHISKTRIVLLRIFYALNFFSLFKDNWTLILFPGESLNVLEGVAISFWASFALVNLLGVRYPLKLIPILLIQLFYKSAWILAVYLPSMREGFLSQGLKDFFVICVVGIILNILLLPWRWIFKHYLESLFPKFTKNYKYDSK